MPDDDRYVEMACAGCGAEWVEDGMEPGPSCPSCGHHEPWSSVENCSRLFALGQGAFDVSASKLIAFLERCAFHGSLTRPRRSRVEIGRWSYDHKDGDTAWKLMVDIQVFKGEDSLRSVILSYWVDGKVAVETTVLSGDRLHDIIATIVRTIQRHSAARVPGVEGLFCHALVEAP